MIYICTKYGFDICIISGSYGGHRQHTTDDGLQTTYDGQKPGVLHKLPTGELKSNKFIQNIQKEKMDEKTILGNIGLLQLVTKQT